MSKRFLANGDTVDALRMVDPHHHFWDLDRLHYPWLVDDPPIRFRYGDYGPLRGRNFTVDDYREFARRWNVVASVAIEAEADRSDPVAETAWLDDVSHETGLPDAFVAFAALDAENAEEVLRRHACYGFVRGIRHKPGREPGIALQTGGSNGTLMEDRRWQRGYSYLAKYGLHFELQVAWSSLREACALARSFPETLIVLNHAGLPADRSSDGIRGWRNAMSEFARCENGAVKISGLGGAGGTWDSRGNRAVIRTVIDIFGPDRCMFASNFPVDTLCIAPDEMMYRYYESVADLPEREKRKLFSENAVRLYRLTDNRRTKQRRG